MAAVHIIKIDVFLWSITVIEFNLIQFNSIQSRFLWEKERKRKRDWVSVCVWESEYKIFINQFSYAMMCNIWGAIQKDEPHFIELLNLNFNTTVSMKKLIKLFCVRVCVSTWNMWMCLFGDDLFSSSLLLSYSLLLLL